ncbi:hydrogenase/urease accessory protein HupE [Micromonospora pisi]|uniref:Hydrogenase/urease accessory protein HupE n=1 Tax=Micromonospora pisi TaxID=589240 RepID=A0A495JVN3_9ACTN|nr:HupE/UreJ family protein [Micromonospora pisi]RKR92921.1 hydrogenase/urease accessory protein HupE [Micromonospora pisi]
MSGRGGLPVLVRRCVVVGAVFAALVGGVAQPASAHGIGGGGETVADFVWLGFTHMLFGWDHLLFVGGVVLLAGQVKRAAKLISLFALGHSTTLIIATLAEWRINAVLVDVVIALSVVFVGVVGFIGRPQRWRWFAVVVLGFGLIHGLGLSTRLQDLGLPSDGLIPRVLAFNVGVELGQLLAVVAMFMIGDVLRGYITWAKAPRFTNVGLVAAGLVTASILVVGAVVGGEDDTPAPTAALGSCQVRERTETYQGYGGHPKKDFYEPDEDAPVADFGHVLGDGYVVVHYQPTMPADQLTQLREFVTGAEGSRVVGGADAQQTETLKAVNAYQTVVCQDFDVPALIEFKKAWFADPRSRPVD